MRANFETVSADSEFDGVSEVVSHNSGRGQVAAGDLPPGSRVARFAGPILDYAAIPAAEANYALGLRGGQWLVPATKARFVNHSCLANCEVWDDLSVVTVRSVRRGEELTISYNLVAAEDYREAPEEYLWDPRWSFDCRCGAPRCHGRIDAYRLLPEGVDGYEAGRLTVRDTLNRGRGVFANLPFAVGELIESCPVLVIPPEQWRHIEPTMLFDYSFTFGPDGEHAAIALGLGSIYNHSYQPNAEYIPDWEPARIRIVARQPIRPGEEITINYNRDPHDDTSVWFKVQE